MRVAVCIYVEHHTGTAPVPKLWKSLIILLDQWCLKRDRSTDLDRLALILQIITLSKRLLCLSLYFKYRKVSVLPDSNWRFLTGNEKCYHYIKDAKEEAVGFEPTEGY